MARPRLKQGCGVSGAWSIGNSPWPSYPLRPTIPHSPFLHARATSSRRMLPSIQELLHALHHVSVQLDLSPHTHRAYRRWARRFLEHLGARGLESVRAEDVRRFLARERRRGATDNTLRMAATAVRFFLLHVGRREVPTPDAFGLRKPKSRARPALTPLEVDSILARLPGSQGLMARLIYRCGLRAVECCSLRVDDVDAERGQLLVRATRARAGRQLELPRDLMREVRIQKERVRRVWIRDWQEGLGVGIGLGEAPPPRWMFPAKTRRRSEDVGQVHTARFHTHPVCLQASLRRAVTEAGLEVARPCSALRQAYAGRCLRRGDAQEDVAADLGLKTVPAAWLP